MAEIRSTLDIIMERTKNMTLSEEEKAEYRIQALSGKIKGWIQRYLDNYIDMEKVQIEIESEKEKDSSETENILKQELMGRLDPENDNSKIFQMLKTLLGMDPEPFIRAIGEFHKNMGVEKVTRIQSCLQTLGKKGISGSAVLPNIDSDPEWQAFYNSEKNNCFKDLTGLAR